MPTNKIIIGLYNVVSLQFFSAFPEYFIAVSTIYVLVLLSLIVYHVHELIVERALSQCMAFILLLACYLVINDSLTSLNFLSFNTAISSDQLAIFAKFVVCLSSSALFFLIAGSLKEQRLTSLEYPLLLLFAVLGLLLLCSSNDFLTAYLAIELASLSSYILASFKKTSSCSVDAGLKYFVMGAVSSAFFLLGSSLIYVLSGSIFIVDLWDLFSYEKFMPYLQNESFTTEKLKIPHVLSEIPGAVCYNFVPLSAWHENSLTALNSGFLEFGLTLILFSLFIKLAVAPFHLWSLDVYEGSPTSSTFFFAVIAKLSIFVFLLRLCYTGLLGSSENWQFCFLWIGVFSVFVGSFGGIKQRKLKTLLAYSSISHMGYAFLAFSTGHVFGVQMLLFYLTVYIMSGLSFWSIVLTLRPKTPFFIAKYNKELGDFVLLKKSNIALALAFSVTAFSVAGIPPLIGFFAKAGVFLSVVQIEFYVIALASILCSVLSTFYYIRIVKILCFENFSAGKLYYPSKINKTLMLSFLLFSLVFLFTNPSLLYLCIHQAVFESTLMNLIYT